MTASIHQWVSNEFPEETLYTISEAAEAVGRSVQTLRRWERNGDFTPSRTAKMGTINVRLYTPEDIKALREFAATQRPGRKPGVHYG